MDFMTMSLLLRLMLLLLIGAPKKNIQFGVSSEEEIYAV